jgi:hypothetical protein
MSSDVIDKRASEFASFFEYNTFQDLNWYNEEVLAELSPIRRASDQRYFLNRLRYHLKAMCEGSGGKSTVEQDYPNLIFVIDQLLDELNDGGEFDKESFSIEENHELISKIAQLQNDLSEIKAGNQVLFEELEELKQMLNLGKKNWKQLLTGKLFDMIVGETIDKATGGRIYESLLQTQEEFVNRISM